MTRRARHALKYAVVGAWSVAAFGGGVYAARALPRAVAAPGPHLSFAGSLEDAAGPMTGAHPLVFKFKKSGVVACATPSLDVSADSAGRFQVDIPLTACPGSLFDGSSVTVDIYVADVLAASDQIVSHVPYAMHAAQLGLSDCPVGYDRDTASSVYVVCKRGGDEIVRVGNGAAAFWVDRFESSVWSEPFGSGVQYDGTSSKPYPSTFPDNGQWSAPLYAASKRGVLPSAHLTWFQAVEACAASGKRLLRNDEWFRAAHATPENPDCNSAPGNVRLTGNAGSCTSIWGAEDMVGNMVEWSLEWFAGVGNAENANWATWPGSSYGSDNTFNVISSVYAAPGSDRATIANGLPAASLRGGALGQLGSSSGAGIFSLALDRAPSNSESVLGFRCAMSR